MAPAAKEFYEDQKNLNKLCNFLRSADGPAVREAIMMDKRVYYIKGEFMKLRFCVSSPSDHSLSLYTVVSSVFVIPLLMPLFI